MAQAVASVRKVGSSGVGRWALTGLLLYPVGWIGSMLAIATIERLLLDPLGIRPEAGTVSLSVRNGLHHMVWGAMVAAVAMPIGRRLVPRIRFDRRGAAVLAVGLGLAAISLFLVIEFDRERSGLFDPDHTGFAIFTAPAIVAVALAAWAAMAVPRADRAPLVLLAGLAGLGFVISLLPSLGGLSDGINPSSVPLAASLLASAAFIVVGLVAARR